MLAQSANGNNSRMSSRSRHSHHLVLASALLWASTGVACALLPAATPAAAIAAARLLVGGSALALGAGRRSFLADLATLPRWPLAAAALAMALFQWSFIAAVPRAGVAVTAFASAAVAPFLADACALLGRGGQATLRWAAAASCCTAGMLALALHAFPAGLALALASGVAYAAYTMAAAKLGTGGQAAGPAASAACLLAAAMALLPGAAVGLPSLLTMRALAVIAWLGLACTALAYRLFAAGLRTLPPSSALALLVAEPVAALLLGVLLLGERPGPADACGFALLVLATLLRRGAIAPVFLQPMKGKLPCPIPAARSSSSTCKTNTSPETC